MEADAGVTPDPVVLAAEPGAGLCVVEIGPAGVPEVSDVLALWAAVLARLLEPALLLLAAEAERALPLQAVMTVATVATRTKETRTDRYIFPTCC